MVPPKYHWEKRLVKNTNICTPQVFGARNFPLNKLPIFELKIKSGSPICQVCAGPLTNLIVTFK